MSAAMSLELSVAFALLFMICSMLSASSIVPKILANDSRSIRCIERERQALVQFKQGLVDAYGLLASWGNHGDDDHKSDCCRWKGVQCSNTTGHVISLNLRAPGCDDFGDCSSLQGNISSSLLVLEHLNYLDLSGNYFESGQFPGFIGSLVKLSYLNLSSCGISAEISYQLNNLSNLKHLDLSFNNLYANNLAWVSALSSLNTLKLIGVGVSNTTDWFLVISSLPHLKYLDLSGNFLLDPSPPSVFNISKSLAYVYLQGPNFFSASSIYPWLFSIYCNLVEVDLSANSLQGPIPEAFGDMASLRYLSLSNNYLQGPIPKALTTMSSLYHLDLSSNQLQGSIPEGFGSMNTLLKLDLSFNQLEGLIPKTLGNLSSLSYLDLSSNQLKGPIPEALGGMSSLSLLNLSHNQLKDHIPEVLGSIRSLSELILSHNQIEGRIPNSFGHLCSLQKLYLSENNLTGELFPSFSGCIEKSLEELDLSFNSLFGPLQDLHRFHALDFLDLSHNQLNGSLSFDVDQTSFVRILDLGHNQITGSLPKELGQFSHLQELSMPSNFLNGTISEVHLSKLSSLTNLDLSFNKLLVFNISPNWIPPFTLHNIVLDSCRLGPHFPNWLRTQSIYDTLSISDARISDKLPTWFWSIFPGLAFVNLSRNDIHGELPTDSAATSITPAEVDLSFNSLEGPIPLFLTNVPYLDLSSNKLSGSISSWNLTNDGASQYLDISQNFLSGELPDCWMNWKYVRVLNLGNNRFSGAIPKSFGELNLLEVLDLGNNNLAGEVPISLKNCTSLRILDLSENFLSGEMPSWIGDMFGLNVLILRHNQFFGNLPVEICRLSYIQVLDLSLNNISGTIPSCLYNFTYLSGRANFSGGDHTLNASQWTNFYVRAEWNYTSRSYFVPEINIHAHLVWKGCTREYWKILALLRIIDLSSNKLTGRVPKEISLLANLQSLNLSRNRLTGPITPKLGQLKYLESLDLSRNQLSGEIPTSFSNLNFLSFLDLSYNNLAGEIPLGTQLQGFNESSYMGNPLLCGPPLQNKCSEDETPTSHHNGGDTGDQDDNILSPGLYISIGLGFATGFWGACGILVLKRSWRYAYFRFWSNLYDRIMVAMIVYIARPIYHLRT